MSRFRTVFPRTKAYTISKAHRQSDGDNVPLTILREAQSLGQLSRVSTIGPGFYARVKFGPIFPIEKQARKEPRRKVFKDGKIVSHQSHGALDVRIRNLSETGALIELPMGTLIPDSFELLIVWTGMLHPASTRWRKGDRMGVEFTGPPKFVSLRKW